MALHRWVIWDFDGTLAKRDGLWGRCLLEVLDSQDPGHGVAPEVLAPFLRNGFPWHDHERAHLDLNHPEKWWESISTILAKAIVGAGYPEQRAEGVARAVRARFLDCNCWEVFEDVVPALSDLKTQGWRHAILSNHVPELEELVRDLGLNDLIDVVFTSARTGYEKPHPRAFKTALENLGEFNEVWMIGDNPIADVMGAEKAGIPSILVRSPEWSEEYVSFVTDSWGGTGWRDWRDSIIRKADSLLDVSEIIAVAKPG